MNWIPFSVISVFPEKENTDNVSTEIQEQTTRPGYFLLFNKIFNKSLPPLLSRVDPTETFRKTVF